MEWQIQNKDIEETANLETVLCFGFLSLIFIFMFGCQRNAAVVVQILHKLKKGQFIKEDLWDLH